MRRINNQIDSIKDNEGKGIRGQEEINEAHNYYKNLLTATVANSNYEAFINHIPKKTAKKQTKNSPKNSKKRKSTQLCGISIWTMLQVQMDLPFHSMEIIGILLKNI